MNYLLKRIASAAVAVMVAIPASASIVSFDFTDGSTGYVTDRAGHYTATVDGLTVDVTAGLYDSDYYGGDTIISTDCSYGSCGRFANRSVSQGNGGLGVNGRFDSGQIDGFLGNDLLTFTFDRVVDFTSVLFSHVDLNDDFDVFVDGVFVGSEINIATSNPFSLASLSVASGQSISFGADGWLDNFRIRALDVNVGAVPLPAGALLLLTGLFGLGFMRRRQSA